MSEIRFLDKNIIVQTSFSLLKHFFIKMSLKWTTLNNEEQPIKAQNTFNIV